MGELNNQPSPILPEMASYSPPRNVGYIFILLLARISHVANGKSMEKIPLRSSLHGPGDFLIMAMTNWSRFIGGTDSIYFWPM
jgi:hypothetical protein